MTVIRDFAYRRIWAKHKQWISFTKVKHYLKYGP
jgi:hypothetical protein